MRTAIFLAGIVIADAIDRYGGKNTPNITVRFVASFLAALIVMDIAEFIKGFFG